jgi:DNA-binding XRE family transcriptional regulator
VDKISVTAPAVGARSVFTSAVAHFGNLLKRLRSERGLTQSALADASGVSLGTIQRAEVESSCPWKATTAVDVLTALEARGSLSAADRKAFSEAAGVSPAAVTDFLKRIIEERFPQAVAAKADDLLNRQLAGKVKHAHVLLQLLIAERGEDVALALMQGLVAGQGVASPPASVIEQSRSWVKIELPPRDGWAVTLHGPPVAPPASPAKPRARRIEP